MVSFSGSTICKWLGKQHGSLFILFKAVGKGHEPLAKSAPRNDNNSHMYRVAGLHRHRVSFPQMSCLAILPSSRAYPHASLQSA